MPYLDIKLSGPCLPGNAQKLAACMTELAVHVLRKEREVTAATVQCTPPGHWTIGGCPIDEQGITSFFLEISVTTGSNTPEEKRAFVGSAFKAAERILGRLAPASYVVVREIPGDSWGYHGLTQQARRLQRIAMEAVA
ncbi:MAG TPA: tautomerase family protein [Rhodocyclaceae bacterium]